MEALDPVEGLRNGQRVDTELNCGASGAVSIIYPIQLQTPNNMPICEYNQ